MQTAQGWTGVHPQIIGQSLAQHLVSGQGLGLASTAVQRQQLQGVETLAQRMIVDEVRRRRSRLRGPADTEQRLQPRLLRLQHELAQPVRFGGCHGAEGIDDIDHRLARHQRQTVVQQGEGTLGIGRHLGVGRLDGPREPPDVEGAVGELEQVARGSQPDPYGWSVGRILTRNIPQRSPQAGDVHLEGRGRRVRWCLAPELGDEAVDRHHPPRVDRQQTQHGPLHRRGDQARPTSHRGRHRTENLHEGSETGHRLVALVHGGAPSGCETAALPAGECLPARVSLEASLGARRSDGTRLS